MTRILDPAEVVELIDKSSILETSIVSLVADEARFTKDVRGLTAARIYLPDIRQRSW